MKEISVNGFRLKISVGKNGYVIFNLSEDRAFSDSENKVKDYYHEDMGFCSPKPRSEIKKSVKHWLSRFDDDLAQKAMDLIDDFFSDDTNLQENSSDKEVALDPKKFN